MKRILLAFVAFITATQVFAVGTSSGQSQQQFPEYWKPAFNALYKRLDKNLKKPAKHVPFWHVAPAPKYPGVYLWDSAFIALIWKNKNSSIAQDVIRSVLHNQQKDGRVPHTIPNNATIAKVLGASPWTQPPVLSWAAAQILRKTKDVKFAIQIYPKLVRFHLWLLENRQLQNGLFFWQHPYESGIDNSPRFGVRDESHYYKTTNVASVDITSYLIMDARALAEIATLLNEKSQNKDFEEDIKNFNAFAEGTSKRMQDYLWHEESGYFLDRNVDSGEFVNVKTIASFFPLAAKAATTKQFLRLREHLVSTDEFNTFIPFPTVSKADPTFEKDMWRGPVWINTSYLVLAGLKEYNDTETVRYFAYRVVDGVYQTWQRLGDFYEFYDPDRPDLTELSRKKGLGPLGLSASKKPVEVLKHLVLKQIILGKKPVNKFAGWTGLVNALAIEELGFDPEAN